MRMSCSQVQNPVRKTRRQMRVTGTVSGRFGRNSWVLQTGGCSQTIMQVKKPDVEVLDWCGHTWSAVARLIGCTVKWSGTTLTAAGTVHAQQLQWTFLQPACRPHIPSKHATSEALSCVKILHIVEWPFIRCTCLKIMLFNEYIDMPHLLGGWIVLAKERCSPAWIFSQICTKK